MVFKILAMLTAVIGICLVFELTPDSITDGLLRALKPKGTIAARSAALRGKEKQSAYLRLIKLKNALKATGKVKSFSVSVTAAVALMFLGRVGGLTFVYATIVEKRRSGAMYPLEKITVG